MPKFCLNLSTPTSNLLLPVQLCKPSFALRVNTGNQNAFCTPGRTQSFESSCTNRPPLPSFQGPKLSVAEPKSTESLKLIFGIRKRVREQVNHVITYAPNSKHLGVCCHYFSFNRHKDFNSFAWGHEKYTIFLEGSLL